MIFFNSLKTERAITTSRAFELPTAGTFVGLKNYIYGIQEMDFLSSFWYSLVITVSSVVLILLCMWILHRTKYGERLFLIGVNPQAAEYSGINTRATIMSTYVLSAVSAAIAGTLLTANVNSAKYDLGSGYTLAIITAVVLGGARVADHLHSSLRSAALLRREHAEPRSADRPDSGRGRSGPRNRRSAHAFSPVQAQEERITVAFQGALSSTS